MKLAMEKKQSANNTTTVLNKTAEAATACFRRVESYNREKANVDASNPFSQYG